MVWRQLPKLIPAGSIPVSRSNPPHKNVRRFLYKEKQQDSDIQISDCYLYI